MAEFQVTGPPGTGKTTYLTAQVAAAVRKYGGDGVMVASFTRAAAVELASRIDTITERQHIGTLHALCYRLLDRPEIAEVHIKEFNEWQRIYTLTGDGADLDEPEQAFDSESDRIFAAYQVCRARLLLTQEWPIEVRAFAKSWEDWKAATGYIDFTDMIDIAFNEAIFPPAEVRVAFFDEVQDFTPLELSLVRLWGDAMDSIVLAGDPDQCIYGFKGATPDAFMSRALPDEQQRVLGQSYRMPAAVHRASQAWIEQIPTRRPVEFKPRAEDGAVHRRSDLFYRHADAIVEEAIDRAVLEREDAIEGGAVMLLTSCSYQLQPIVKALRERGALFHNPYRRKRGDWNPLRPARGLSTSQRLLSLMRFDPAVWGDDARPWTYGDLTEWMPLVRKTGVFRRGSWSKIIEGQPTDLIASAAILMNLLEDGVEDAIRNNPLRWAEEHVASDKQGPLAYPLRVARLTGARTLKDGRPQIVVGTIHSVKGGQANDVFLFPDLSKAGYMEWMDDRTRAGVIRQFYVGMSRARNTLNLCAPSTPEAVQWRVPA